MKKLLLSMMAFAALYSAEAKKVKFQVDMTGQTVSGQGVHIAGNFQGWSSTGTVMSNGGSGNIYSVIVDVPAHTVAEFKFLNGDQWSNEEAVPAISKVESAANGGSNGNRWFYIDSTANDTSVFPAVLFSGSAPAGMFAVRFAVDMRNETISANGVHIAGTAVLPNWTPAANAMANLFTNNKVYELISYIGAGTYEFKYVNGNDWNAPSVPENVPSTCATGGNRSVNVTADVALAKVCFASCTACPTAPIPTYSLSFIVDMANSDCDGVIDSVTVAGAGPRLTSFGAGIKMTQIPNTQMYAVVVDSLDSGEVEFKYRAHRNGNTGWEGGDNRLWQLASHDTVDLTCFGSRTVGPCTPKPAPSNITFKVDMTQWSGTVGAIYVMGTFQNPNWQGGAIRLSPSAGQPGVFETTVNNVCPGTFNYKFVNGDSSVSANEENFPDSTNRGCVEPSGVGGFNRVYTRTAATPVTLYYVYNTCTPGTNVGVNELALNSTFKLFPNPAQSYTIMEFNDKSTSHDVVVMDITGRTIQSYSDYKQNTLLINTDEMSKGIYFIKASNTRNESVTSKLIVR